MTAFARPPRPAKPVPGEWVIVGKAFGSPIFVDIGPPYLSARPRGNGTVPRLVRRTSLALYEIYTYHFAPGTRFCGPDFSERLKECCRYWAESFGPFSKRITRDKIAGLKILLPMLVRSYEGRGGASRSALALAPDLTRGYPNLAAAKWGLHLVQTEPAVVVAYWQFAIPTLRRLAAAKVISQNQAQRRVAGRPGAKRKPTELHAKERFTVTSPKVQRAGAIISRAIYEDLTHGRIVLTYPRLCGPLEAYIGRLAGIRGRVAK